MAMHDPRTHPDLSARMHRLAQNLVIGDGLANYVSHRRVETQRLQQRHAQSGPASEIIERGHAIRRKCSDFGSQTLLLSRVERQQVGSPEQHACCRLEAAEDHRRALVAYLGRAEHLARLSIARGEQEIEQIALAASRWDALPLGDDLVDGCEPRPLKRAALRRREGERILGAWKRVKSVATPSASDISSNHYANFRALLAVRH